MRCHALFPILFCLASHLCARSVDSRVYAFDGAASISALQVHGATAELTRTSEDGEAIEGAGAAHVALRAGPTWTTVQFDAASGLAPSWAGRGKLVLHIHNASEFVIPVALTISDAAGGKYRAHPRLVRSNNVIEVPLEDIRTAQGSALDLGRIQSMRLEFQSAEKFPRDLWLSNFHLAGSRPARNRSQLLLSFGPQGWPLLEGARRVDEATRYAGWRGFGWTSDVQGLTSAQFNQPKPDPMLSSFVWAGLGLRTAALRVDLPDGVYRARFWGGDYTSKVMAQRSFALAVDGKRVATRRPAAAPYYSKAEFFRGMDEWYTSGEDTWARCARDLYQHYDFSFTVSGGKTEFVWSETLAAFALLISPEADFPRALGRVESAQRAWFERNLNRPKPIAATPEAIPGDRANGFIVWSRDWQKGVAPYDLPEAAEKVFQTLRLTAALTQRTHATVTITPLRQLGEVQASVTDLKNERGDALPSSVIEVRAVKYLWDGWPASLDLRCLFPSARVPSPGNVNVTWWLTATPPANAQPGLYRGVLRISSRDGGEAAVPVEMRVWPFRLLTGEEHGFSFSLWRNSDYNMGYALRPFLPEQINYFRRLLRAEVSSMKAHGMTAFHFTAPWITAVHGDEVTLDFSILKEECLVVREYSLADSQRPGYVFLTLEIMRNLMHETRHGDFQEPEDLSVQLPESERDTEFSDRFNRRFRNAVWQIQTFFDSEGIPVTIQVADEPRERNINQWNRDLADTIRYADMVRAEIPHARLFFDPEADENYGVDYLPLLDHSDIIATHPWDQSARIYERTRGGRPTLQYYNATIHDRFDYGFEIAASHSTGFGQWHFQWQMLPFQPFQAENRSGVTLPGPDGPLDTPDYEMMAAGIDDFRFVATLRARLAAARDAGRSGSAVNEAEDTLKELLAAAEPYAQRAEYFGTVWPRVAIAGISLDEWRARLAARIMALQQ